MYNTIEVIALEIKNIEIKHFGKHGFSGAKNENLRHVKILPYLSIVQSVEGSYDITLGNGATQKTGEGGFFIAPAGVEQTIVHHVSPENKTMTCRWIFLDVVINKTISIDTLYQFPTVINDEQKHILNAFFDRLFETDDIWENYGDCYKLMKYLVQMAKKASNEIHPDVQRAIAFMKEHYTEEIRITSLADMAGTSESNFYAIFKKATGTSPIAYLNNYRLSVAAERLIETESSVSEIAYSVGINDPLYFSKLFKRTYGTSPKEYRRIHRKG